MGKVTRIDDDHVHVDVTGEDMQLLMRAMASISDNEMAQMIAMAAYAFTAIGHRVHEGKRLPCMLNFNALFDCYWTQIEKSGNPFVVKVADDHVADTDDDG